MQILEWRRKALNGMGSRSRSTTSIKEVLEARMKSSIEAIAS